MAKRTTQQTKQASDAKANVSSSAQEEALPEIPARRRIKVGTLVVLIVVAFLLIAAALFAWNRWWRFDDTADIQGIWLDSNGAEIAIDDTRLLLGNQVIYDYTIDTMNKTIAYSYDNVQGYASYRFSGDRNVLVLQENASTDWLQALHIKEDTVLAGAGDLPEGCSRLQRQEGYAQDAFDTFANKKQNSSSSPAAGQDQGQSTSQAEDDMDAQQQTDEVQQDSFASEDESVEDSYTGEEYYDETSDQYYDESSDGYYDDSSDGYYDDSYEYAEGYDTEAATDEYYYEEGEQW